MLSYEEYMKVNEGSPFYYVCGRDEGGRIEFLGDLTLLNDGTAVVNNDWDGIGNRYFDTHVEALRYVLTRMCEDAFLWDPDSEQAKSIVL